jgi:hypothetical protein
LSSNTRWTLPEECLFLKATTCSLLTGLVQMFSLYPAACPVIFDRMIVLVFVECIILLVFLILFVFSSADFMGLFCLYITI